MKRPVRFLILALLLSSTLPALADGMFYWPEPVPPGVPYQRALLLFDGQYETLIVQSQYRLPAAPEEEFGWVVPVPSVPGLASMDPQVADRLFLHLSDRTQPQVTDLSDLASLVVFLALTLTAVMVLLLCVLSYFLPSMHFVRRHRRKLATGGGVLLVFVAVSCYLGMLFLGRSASPGQEVAGIDILEAEQVGIYDVRVVRASQSQDLIQWLNQNQFHFDDADTETFDQYLQRGWNFVVARIDAASQPEGQEIASEGLVAPLILRFPVEDPVYPLALTSTSGRETQILLYLLSDHRMQGDDRLDLHYAGRTGRGMLDDLQSWEEHVGALVESWEFFTVRERNLSYLCKFKGTLSPEEMQEDLSLVRVGGDQPFRRHIVTW